MENIKISQVCGLCAGCYYAIDTTINELNKGNSVTIFKEIVHNKNVNNYLASLGAKCENSFDNLSTKDIIIIRAHGEPPETYDLLNSKGFQYRDCTCHNVKVIHDLVKEYHDKGYTIIIIGKYKNSIHPEVLGTMGWAQNNAVLVETEEDIDKLNTNENEKFYLVCQTTFNMEKADKLIEKIQSKIASDNREIIINKSICSAQKIINEYSKNLAKESDIMIVVGGAKSSNSIELYNNVNKICPSIFIEDIHSYKLALQEKGLKITPITKVGITAGASTMKSELIELKKLIEDDLKLQIKKTL